MVKKCKSIGCSFPRHAEEDFCPICLRQHDLHSLNTLLTLKEAINTVDPHLPGAKLDAEKVRMHLITGGMARAITEVAKVATFGAKKYTDHGWVAVANGFTRYEDAQQRHAAARHMEELHDEESKLLHLAHEAWNCLAKLDIYLRDKQQQ